MEGLELRIYGDRVLRSQNEMVREFGSELSPFLAEMVDAMLREGGVGLAAPQVGVSRQIAVINPEPENKGTLVHVINPRIVYTSREKDAMEEGCLSIPGIRSTVTRPASIEVVYHDREGVEHALRAEGLLARIIQHEVDHLNGILFIDHLSMAQRSLLKSKLRTLMQDRRRGG